MYRQDELPTWVYWLVYLVIIWGILDVIGVYFYYGDLLWTTYRLESLPWAYWFEYWAATWMITIPVSVILFGLSMILASAWS